MVCRHFNAIQKHIIKHISVEGLLEMLRKLTCLLEQISAWWATFGQPFFRCNVVKMILCSGIYRIFLLYGKVIAFARLFDAAPRKESL